VSPAPLASVVALGFVLGLQHATDPDHVVAVATIATRERRFRDGVRVGVFWGLGHALTLTAAGGLVVAFGLTVSPRAADGLELAVAAMLVVLGVVRLGDALPGLRGAPTEHLAAAHVADHDHDGAEVFHTHAHAHHGHVHAHPHVHPSRRLLAAIGAGTPWRALVVGLVHGVAGTAALSLLVLATVHSTAGALLYLVVFGTGTIAGMTALTAVMAYPVARAARLAPARRVLALGAAAGSIAYGIFYALRLI
jgi:ABC-type nickel/cobalt efflux system permease component RcnA